MKTDILSQLIITRVRSASTFYNFENVKIKRSERKQWAIVIKYEGETVYTCCQKRYQSDANHIMILPRGSSYDWQCTKSGHFSIVEFESDAVFPEIISVPVKDCKKILKMIKELENKRNLKGATTEIESIRDTYSILLALLQADAERYLPSERQKKIAPAVEYVSEHYHEALTNDSLAARTGLSTVYFRKLFTESMGISPIAYAHRLRVKKAKEMLDSDHGSLSEIAHSLGYASLYDFSRDFKKHTGVAPSKYKG